MIYVWCSNLSDSIFGEIYSSFNFAKRWRFPCFSFAAFVGCMSFPQQILRSVSEKITFATVNIRLQSSWSFSDAWQEGFSAVGTNCLPYCCLESLMNSSRFERSMAGTAQLKRFLMAEVLQRKTYPPWQEKSRSCSTTPTLINLVDWQGPKKSTFLWLAQKSEGLVKKRGRLTGRFLLPV